MDVVGGGQSGVTVDPCPFMGRREWKWWRQGGRDSTVSPPVGNGVGGIWARGRARGSGVGDRREKSEVLEGKEGIGKVREGFADARETSGGEEDDKTAIVVGGGGKIEPASAVLGPRLTGERRVKDDDELTRGVDGVGCKVEGHTMKALVSREGRVERPRAHVVEGGELGLGDQVVPAVRGNGDVGGRKDGDDVIFGETN